LSARFAELLFARYVSPFILLQRVIAMWRVGSPARAETVRYFSWNSIAAAESDSNSELPGRRSGFFGRAAIINFEKKNLSHNASLQLCHEIIQIVR
jgi:hypothetical protein